MKVKRMFFTSLLAVLMCVAVAFSAVGCGSTSASGWLVYETNPTESNEADVGTMWLNSSTYDIYRMTEIGWSLVGNIKGATGEKGDTGETGETGADGADGSIAISEDGYIILDGEATDINIYYEKITEEMYLEQPAYIRSWPTPTSTTRAIIVFQFRTRAGTKVTFNGDASEYRFAVVETYDNTSNSSTYKDSGWLTDNEDYDGTYTSVYDGGYLILTMAYADNSTISDISSIHDLFSVEGYKVKPTTIEINYNGDNNSEYAVKSVNHRGYSSVAPENTLSAYRLSATMGFKYVETDVSFTSDGYAVLLHDSTVDRTSNGTGNISSLTYDYVRSLDFGSWKSSDYAGEQISTFEEFIALCKNLSLHPYVEIKTGATASQVQSLVKTVISYGMKDQVTWISFDLSSLQTVVAQYNKARVGYIVSSISASTITNAQTLETGYNEVFLDCDYTGLTSAAVELCINALIPLEVWTVDSESAILALDPYVSGVTSNYLIAGQILKETYA